MARIVARHLNLQDVYLISHLQPCSLKSSWTNHSKNSASLIQLDVEVDLRGLLQIRVVYRDSSCLVQLLMSMLLAEMTARLELKQRTCSLSAVFPCRDIVKGVTGHITM